ncbi:hypothetical protein [Natrinema pallidum]|uniref:Uncharacterized protein n=1 Tax=Natrinema pallidum DSM 3751 TaxID=1227495 RepID=L9YTD2_9EURY|nr:hypothetical protein [Natrinema pallidum]ELY76737.1 hypothetical protein C487_10544 [Natrinema pallidum DSM 3751]
MQFKPVPEPPADRTLLATVRRALPATAGDVDDCCQRLVDETPLETREAAATWLTFLRALEIASEDPAGFRRRDAGSGTPDDHDREELGRAFRDRVYGAEPVLTVLERADGPRTVEEVVDAVGEQRRADGRTRPSRATEHRRERIERLLGWAVVFDLAERDGAGYRSTRASET